jgi:hypothetical protein
MQIIGTLRRITVVIEKCFKTKEKRILNLFFGGVGDSKI